MKFRIVLAVLFGLFALLTLADRFTPLELLVLRGGVPLLFAIATAIAIIGAGAIARGSREADPALDFIIGFPIFGALLFLVGLMKVSVWTIVPLIAILAIAGIVLILAGWSERPRLASTTSSFALLAVAVVIVCGFVTALAPPTSIDEVSSTLAVPRAWALEGRAIELPLLAHSYFPLGIESADLAPIAILGAIHGGVASHLLHLFAAIATATLLFRRTESWLLTSAIVTTPALALSAGWSLGDWPLVGLFVVTYIALERDEIRLASTATAAGLLTSYLFLPFVVVAWALRRRRPHWIALTGLLFFVRNIVLTWSPLAPFFGASSPPLFAVRDLALADYVFTFDRAQEALGVAVLALPFFATSAIAIAAAILAIGLFFLAPGARVLVPFLVVPSMTATKALEKKIVAILIGIAIAAQTLLVVWFTARSGAFTLIAAATNTDSYLRKQRPEYDAIAWLNGALPAGSRTLVVGIGETYWFTKPVRGGASTDAARISHYLALPAPEALRERLRGDGITHVAVLTSDHGSALEPAAQKMLAQTLDHYAATVTTRGNATLFTLR